MTKFNVCLFNNFLHPALFGSVREQSVLLDASNNFVEFVEEGAAVLVAEKKTGKLVGVVWHKLEPVAQRLAVLEIDPA